MTIREANQQRNRVLIAFTLVYAACQAFTFLAVLDAFHNPATAGLALTLRAVPSFFIGWLTGFAADYHRTTLLSWLMIGLAATAFLLPPIFGLFWVGLLVAWAEVSLTALLAEQKTLNPTGSAIRIGFGYDIAKLASVPLVYVLTLAVGPWILGSIAAVGTFLLRSAYIQRPTREKSAYSWKANVVLPTVAVAFAQLGVGSLLWMQGNANPTLTGFLLAAAALAVGALIGNVTLIKVANVGYWSSVVGVAGMIVGVTGLATHPPPTAPIAIVIIWMIYGWGAAVSVQSARAILLRNATGRDSALFTTTMRISVMLGGIILSAALPYHYIVAILAGLLSVSVLAYGAWGDKRTEAPS